MLWHRGIFNEAAQTVAASQSTTTFDPGNASANLILSNGNLTATVVSNDYYNTVRTIASNTTGKKYCELSWTGTGYGSFYGAGPCMFNSSYVIGVSPAPSDSANSLIWGFYVAGVGYDGKVRINALDVGTIGTSTSPVTTCIAIDLGAKLFWGRFDGGNWNGNAAYDPGAGTGGIDISSMSFGTMYLGIELVGALDACTANFGGSAYSFTVPTGFGNW